MAPKIKFLDWYLKIGAGSALVGASMELFMIKTGFYDKVTVLEAEKRAWDSSPEAQAVREALNPWRKHDAETGKVWGVAIHSGKHLVHAMDRFQSHWTAFGSILGLSMALVKGLMTPVPGNVGSFP